MKLPSNLKPWKRLSVSKEKYKKALQQYVDAGNSQIISLYLGRISDCGKLSDPLILETS